MDLSGTTADIIEYQQTRMYGEARPAHHVTCQNPYSSIKKFVQLEVAAIIFDLPAQPTKIDQR